MNAMLTVETRSHPSAGPAGTSAGDRTSRAAAGPARLVIDARMLFASGIGRYLREVLARWPEATVPEAFLYATEEQQAWLSAARPRAALIPTPAGIYSLREQLLPWGLPADVVYWVPHYNLPWLGRARIVATVHDAAPLVLREAFPRPAQRLAARFYFSAVRRRARRVLVVSEFTAGELTRHARVRRELIEVVPNGVDAAWQRATAGKPRRPHRLLFVGNLKAHKNLGRLLEAIKRVRTGTGRDVSLDVVGQTSGFRAGLEHATADRLRRTPWVRLHGKIDDAQLRTLYAEAGALVFPSLYEGFGLPMLEAMAAGCPVVAARAGALPEIGGPDQRDGGGVVYIDPRDPADIATQLERFWQLPETEHFRMGEFGRARTAQFSWDETARRTREVLLAEVQAAAHRRA
jgi:glycosyltransferase involved in cell wall biosynthesis